MVYAVKEIFKTLQGEGAQAGRASVFCRFAGCNLWSGLEKDRAAAACNFCDTDFVGTNGTNGDKFQTAAQLADTIEAIWGNDPNHRYVVFTGGEPLLQLDEKLITALHEKKFKIAIETNGTLPAPAGIDWICVSPKARSECIQQKGDELKLVYPQAHANPEKFEKLPFTHFFLQPMDGPNVKENTRLVIDYCLHHPQWRISLQTHKLMGIS